MHRTDHILALTTTLLAASEDEFQKIFSIAENIYILNEVRKPGAVSLGVREGDLEGTFASWISHLRDESVLQVNLFYNASEKPGMAPHIEAAFAGIPDLLMQITTESHTRTYLLATFLCPQYEITPEQFIALLNAQPNKEMAWSRAATLILDSNQLNNRTIFDPAEAQTYLTTSEGRVVFEYLASDLIKEVQIEYAIHEQAFIIPESLQSLFVKYNSSFPFGDNHEYVLLYPLKDITPREMLTMAEAQPFHALIWEKLNQILELYADPQMVPVPPAQWKEKILTMESESFKRIVLHICRSIGALCEEHHTRPVIPEALADSFGPDAEEQKRSSARARADKDRWSLQGTRQPWEYYAFQQVEYNGKVDAPSAGETRRNFITALDAIHLFATAVQSPFEEAFRMSKFVQTQPFPPGKYDEAHINLLAEQLQADFSERAVGIFRDTIWVAEFFTTLGWEDIRVRSMLAIRFADVFGGMGSWNDQYMEQDHEQYQAVSATLFDALKKYSASLLSWRSVDL